MDPNGSSNLEAIVEQQIRENDDIADIRTTLQQLIELDIDTHFCISLLPKLVKLASDTRTEHISEYGATIGDIFGFLYSSNIYHARRFFQDTLQCTRDLLEGVTEKDATLQSASLLSIQFHATPKLPLVISILASAMTLMLESEPVLLRDLFSQAWRLLPHIIDTCVDNVKRNTRAEIIARFAKTCINQSQVLHTCELEIEVLLVSLLQAMQVCISNSRLSETWSECICQTLSQSSTDSFNVTAIANMLEDIASMRQDFVVQIHEPILKLACHILLKRIDLPWLELYMERVGDVANPVTLLRARTLLTDLRRCEDMMDQTHTQASNLATSSQYMDIDSSQLCEKPEPKDIFANTQATLMDCFHACIKQLLSAVDAENAEVFMKRVKEVIDVSDELKETLLQPFDNDLAHLAVSHLANAPEISESIASLYDLKLNNYLRARMHCVLPHALHTGGGNDLVVIAARLGLTSRSLCEKGAHHIFVDLLMKDDDALAEGMDRLRHITGEDPLRMIMSHKTKITSILAMELGWPQKRQQALRALERVRDGSDAGHVPMSQYLSVYFLGIINRVGKFLTEKRSGKLVLSYPQTLEALNEVMYILGTNIRSHLLQLMTTFQTVGELPGLQSDSLKLWSRFICMISPEDLSPHLDTIIRGLLSMFPRCDKNDRRDIAAEIYGLVADDRHVSKSNLEQLPEFPAFEELAAVKSLIQEKQRSFGVKSNLETIIFRIRDDDIVKKLSGLNELYQLLKRDGNLHETVLKEHNELYSLLLNLSRKRVEMDEIRNLAATCLGILGATDPSRLDVKNADTSVVVLHNFADAMENQEFILDLITQHLIPAFHSSANERIHQYIQYAIQMLLREAGFTYASINSSTNRAIRSRWNQLPVSVQNMLAPLLQSSFESQWKVNIMNYPIYPNVEGYAEWLRSWYYRLAESSQSSAKSLFSACIPVIKSGNMGIALYLLPYLILHVLLSGSSTDRSDITQEIISVLTTNSQATSSQHEKTTQASLQVVVLVTEHCRKWIRRKQNSAKDWVDDGVGNIRQFLDSIPNDLMAMASFRSKAYAQALLLLELHIRSALEKHKSVSPQILENLRLIYAHMDDADGMAAIFSMFQRTLSVDEEILQFESTNQWENAKICYEESLRNYPEDLQKYTNYFNCLRQQSNFGSMLDKANKLIDKFPSWFPKLNAYRVEASWKIGEWDTLAQATKLPMERTFDALIASALGNIREHNHLALHMDLEKAHMDQTEYLSTTSMESYNRSHDCIFRLQLIQEMKDSQLAWERSVQLGSPEPMIVLNEHWQRQFRYTVPSYRIQKPLLDLRRTVLFELRQDDDSPFGKFDDGSLWILTAKTARKAGDTSTAYRAILNAETFNHPQCYIERAKWYWHTKQISNAVQFLNAQPELDAKGLLLLAKYTEEMNTVDKTSIAMMYRRLAKLSPNWEKAHYAIGRFYDSVAVSSDVKGPIAKYFRLLQFVASHYSRALQLGSKFYYYTMPRLLTIWLQFGDHMRMPDITDPKIKAVIEQGYAKLNETMKAASENLRPYQFGLILPRLVSRLSSESEEIARVLMSIISKVLMAYPRTTIWSLLAPAESKFINVRKRCQMIIDLAERNNALLQVINRQARDFTRNLWALAVEQLQMDQSSTMNLKKFPGLSRMKDLSICIPKEMALLPTLPENISDEYNPFPDDLPTIKGFDDNVHVMKSLQQPKKITLLGSDGKRYPFLCKKNDDLRKDARMMEFSYMINTFLKKDSEARQRQLYIRTYAIIPLGENWGLIEWINNLSPLKSIVSEEWASRGISIRAITSNAKNALENKSEEQKEKVFTHEILPHCPAVFYKWFLDKFPEPSEWFNCRARYTRTLAVMSIVGYILGLGDRHAENILFDQTNGDCVHVDVNMLFDKGQALLVPEIVPFRLTNNLIDAMGVLRYEGTFRKTCEVTLNVLRMNKVQLLSVFETFVHDPLTEWRRRGQSNATAELGVLPRLQEMAKRQMDKIEQKIDNGRLISEDVDRLIAEASNNKHLAQMFIGWAPFV